MSRNGMTLEDKFRLVVRLIGSERANLFLRAQNGILKIGIKPKWDDGLDHITSIRIVNTAIGMSTAPADWDHLLRVLDLNGVTEDHFNMVLNGRIDMFISRSHQTLRQLEKEMGTEHVEEIKKKTEESMSFAEEIAKFVSEVMRPEKPKTDLTVLKGGKE